MKTSMITRSLRLLTALILLNVLFTLNGYSTTSNNDEVNEQEVELYLHNRGYNTRGLCKLLSGDFEAQTNFPYKTIVYVVENRIVAHEDIML